MPNTSCVCACVCIYLLFFGNNLIFTKPKLCYIMLFYAKFGKGTGNRKEGKIKYVGGKRNNIFFHVIWLKR